MITEATLNDIYPQYKLLREAKKGFGYPTQEHNQEKDNDQLSISANEGINFLEKKDSCKHTSKQPAHPDHHHILLEFLKKIQLTP